jgi:hypothetical protein
MALTVTDSTGSGAGWKVTLLASDFVLDGGDGSSDIPAGNFSITSADDPSRTAGQEVGPGGPMVPPTSPIGALDTERTVLEAGAGFGAGTYTQTLGVSLTIPARSQVGTYTGSLTATIAAAP